MRNILGALGIAMAIGGLLLYLRPAPPPESLAQSTRGEVNKPDPTVVDPERWAAAFPLIALAAPSGLGNAPADRAFDRALEPYRKGDYVAAAAALDSVLVDHPDHALGVLYLAVARLMMEEPQNALEILNGMPVTASKEQTAEAQWYTLVGIARLRDPRDVEPRAKTLCEAGEQRACDALRRLGR